MQMPQRCQGDACSAAHRMHDAAAERGDTAPLIVVNVAFVAHQYLPSQVLIGNLFHEYSALPPALR